VRLTILAPSVSRLSRKFRSLDISQRYGSPQPVTGIVLLFALLMIHCRTLSSAKFKCTWNRMMGSLPRNHAGGSINGGVIGSYILALP
jgi:hypothetical protein